MLCEPQDLIELDTNSHLIGTYARHEIDVGSEEVEYVRFRIS